jgi:hypothetical protein
MKEGINQSATATILKPLPHIAHLSVFPDMYHSGKYSTAAALERTESHFAGGTHR